MHSLRTPTMKDGMNEKVLEFEEYFMKNKPSWIQVQHPDVQSAFNSAHLIRGNDIIYDFFDSPDLYHDFIKEQGPPEKRNILIQAKAQGSMDDAKRLYEKLKKALGC